MLNSKKNISIFFSNNKQFAFFILLLFIFNSLYTTNSFSQNKYKLRKVVIDAGHGGKDPGAVGKKSYEKDIALAIALKVGGYIEKYIAGVEVVYTRKTDVFIELHKRGEIANSQKADLFISIHVNSNRKKTLQGTSTYIMGLHKSTENLELAKLENSVILSETNFQSNYQGFNPNSPESHITLTLIQNAYQEQSLLLASKIQEQFSKRAGRIDKGVRQAGLVVLWNTTMPSVLVETGFISNAEEERFLLTTYGQEIIASAIFRAFRDYKEEVEKNNALKVNNTSTNQTNRTSKNKIIFRVQIKSSIERIPLNSKQFKNLKPVYEATYKRRYKYMVGNSNSFSSILKFQSEVRKKIPDAFVVAYQGNKRISIQEAKQKMSNK